MDFSGKYLTYDEYLELGGTLAEMSFYLLEYEVSRKIDVRTFGRLVDLEEIPLEVKMCEFNMINRLQSYAEALENARNVASVNTDGYSESYITSDKASDIAKSKDKELDGIIRDYLLNVIVNGEHLLYVGVK